MAQVIVLGAGMVGVSTALALQSRGHQVSLVDRRGIGRETSYGNAGAIQTEAVEPYAFPRDLPSILKVVLKRTNDVNWHLSSLGDFAAPLLRYWSHSAPTSHARISKFYAQIVQKADLCHQPLIEASGMRHLIEHGGYRCLFRTPALFEAAVTGAERVKAAWGVDFTAEDGATLAAAEPNLRCALAGAIHYGQVWTCRSPGALTAAYGRLFVARGGKFAYGDAQSLGQKGAGWHVRTEEGLEEAEHVVLALGPWSDQLALRFGYRIPLLRKRGYHRHYQLDKGPRTAILDAERGTFLARMDQGLRLTTGAELTRRDGLIDLAQLKRSEAAARELFGALRPVETDPWFGDRPVIPDMLPVMGSAPNHSGLWFHFGHGHQGFTAGPSSAKIFADLFDGVESELTQGLSPRRFL